MGGVEIFQDGSGNLGLRDRKIFHYSGLHDYILSLLQNVSLSSGSTNTSARLAAMNPKLPCRTCQL